MPTRPKRPRDPAQLAKLVVDLATMDETDREKLVAKKSPRSKKSGKRHIPGKRGSSST
jgi:hypothetical protein